MRLVTPARARKVVRARMARARRHLRTILADSGAVLVITVLLMPVTFGFLGLMLDGAMLYAAQRELQDAADSAALAGAMQVDLWWFNWTGKWRIANVARIDGARTAAEAADEVCSAYAVSCSTRVPWGYEGRLIRVTAERDFRTLIIHVLTGRRQLRLRAESAAIMVPGY